MRSAVGISPIPCADWSKYRELLRNRCGRIPHIARIATTGVNQGGIRGSSAPSGLRLVAASEQFTHDRVTVITLDDDLPVRDATARAQCRAQLACQGLHLVRGEFEAGDDRAPFAAPFLAANTRMLRLRRRSMTSGIPWTGALIQRLGAVFAGDRSFE